MSKFELDLADYLPVDNDLHMRRVFGDPNMRAALITKMKKEVLLDGSCPLMAVRNYLFSGSYQFSRSLSDKRGGHNARV